MSWPAILLLCILGYLTLSFLVCVALGRRLRKMGLLADDMAELDDT